jgi:hypothetical protein
MIIIGHADHLLAALLCPTGQQTGGETRDRTRAATKQNGVGRSAEAHIAPHV